VPLRIGLEYELTGKQREGQKIGKERWRLPPINFSCSAFGDFTTFFMHASKGQKLSVGFFRFNDTAGKPFL